MPLIDNISWDGSRKFLVHLSEPAGSSLGSSVSTVFITDDECAFSFDSASQHVSEGQYAPTLTVYRDGFIGRTASVRYTTIAGTAQAGSDFVQVSSVLTFASNQYSATIEIPLLDDNEFEPDETFSIQLSDPVGGELGAIASALLTIHDQRPALVVTNCDEDILRTAIAAAGFTSGSVFFDCDGIITLTAPLVITNELVRLDARGHNVALSGNFSNRVFEVLPGASLTLVNLTIANGRSTNGGGIFNHGKLSLIGCSIATNTAEGFAGINGIAGTNGTISSAAQPVPITPGGLGGNGERGGTAGGGGIYNLGTLLCSNSHFIGNRTVGGRGGNAGFGGRGGYGIDGFGRVRFCEAGGNPGLAGSGGDSFGAAFYNAGEASLAGSTFAGNSAIGGLGGLGGVGGSVPCGLGPIAHTQAGQGGAAQGGAWFNEGTLLIERCLASYNSSTGGAGGDAPESNSNIQQAGQGGNGGNASGGAGASITSNLVSNTTIFGNKAVGGRSGFSAHYGGGIGCPAPGGNGGDAHGGGLSHGSGLFDTSYGNWVIFTTLWENLAVSGYPTNLSRGGCGGLNELRLGTFGQADGHTLVASNSLWIAHSILGGSTPSNQCVGFINDLRNNLCSDASANFTDASSRNNTNPILGPLANHGGPTLTMSPMPTSPAIDASADDEYCSRTDQRGVPRPQGAHSDIGAVEATFLSIVKLADGDVRLSYAGIPGESYTLEGKPAFSELWSAIETKPAGPGGSLQYSDLPGSAAQRVFRVKSP